MGSLLHKDSTHLATNIVVHYILLLSLQDFYSGWEMIFTIYYSILAGNIFSGVFMPNQVSVGASVYVFAVLGLKVAHCVTLLLCLWKSLKKTEKMRHFTELTVAAVIVLLGFHTSNDVLNHSYGLLTGLIVGLMKVLFMYT